MFLPCTALIKFLDKIQDATFSSSSILWSFSSSLIEVNPRSLSLCSPANIAWCKHTCSGVHSSSKSSDITIPGFSAQILFFLFFTGTIKSRNLPFKFVSEYPGS
eukprot:NODE_15_length_50561_cov_0.608081.p37 type:complete len:104 gc:universal NODE_15_length_50561_cov_0.608081:28581-28270(-)